MSPQPSLLQAEQPQLSQPVLIGEVLQPLNHLCGLLWTHSNRSVSFLCWGLQSWTRTPDGLSPERNRGAESPPSICWPRFSCCSPGYGWPSGLQAHFGGSCPAFYPSVPPSPSRQAHSNTVIILLCLCIATWE